MNRPEVPTDQGLFDFITNAEFKADLEADYAELQAAVKGGQRKAAHVLAGSIIEAMLLDYLIAVGHKGLSEEALSGWVLAKLIAAGEEEGILTDKTKQLCAVIKDYRNLIHAGRLLRLQETVTQEGANVALSLMRIVARDIAKKKAESYGYTAEQIMRKLEDDVQCVAILPHLLRGMKAVEKDRLLLDALPRRNYELCTATPNDDDWRSVPVIIRAFRECYRLLWDQASGQTKKRALQQYVAILKEQTALYRLHYEERFFQFTDLDGVADAEEARLIKDHILGRLKAGCDVNVLAMAKGIGKTITEYDVQSRRADCLWTPFLACQANCEDDFKNWFRDQYEDMPPAVRTALELRMKSQAEYYEAVENVVLAARVREILDARFPF